MENYIEVVVESLAVIVALFAIWPAHKPRQQPTSNNKQQQLHLMCMTCNKASFSACGCFSICVPSMSVCVCVSKGLFILIWLAELSQLSELAGLTHTHTHTDL